METNLNAQGGTPVKDGISVKKAAWIVVAVIIAVIAGGITVGKMFFWKPEVITMEDRQLELVEQYIKKNPEDPKGYLMKGDYYFKMRNSQEALKYFNKAEQMAPESETAKFYAGLALAQMKKFDEAIEKMEPLVKKQPTNFDSGYYLASVYYAKGDYEKTVETLNNVLRFSPEAADAHVLVAKAYYKNKDVEKAKNHLSSALKMVPDYDEALAVKKAVESGGPIE